MRTRSLFLSDTSPSLWIDAKFFAVAVGVQGDVVGQDGETENGLSELFFV